MNKQSPDFTPRHQRGEDSVKAVIQSGEEFYSIKGREQNVQVAENMAYAAKPLIDQIIGEMETSDPSLKKILTDPHDTNTVSYLPAITTEAGRTHSYRDLQYGVEKAHKKANFHQKESYVRLERVAQLREQADRIEAEVYEGL